MRLRWPLILFALLCFGWACDGGTFSCSATCLSKLASLVSIGANGKAIVSGAKKLRHPKRKDTKKGTK